VDEQKKLEQLYRDHYQMLCRSAYRIVRDMTHARDVVQDVFIELWSNRQRWAEIRSFRAYLLSSVYHRSLNFVKVPRRFIALSDDQRHLKNSIEEEIETRELAALIAMVIDSLPAKCKEIFILSREEGLSYQQMADQLNLSVKTVEAQMGIALKRIRQSLAAYERIPPKIFLLFV